MADHQIGDLAERIRLLREKAAREGVRVPDDVFEYIAGKYGLAQTLKSALVQVMVESARRGLPVDLALARRALGDPPLPTDEAAPPTSGRVPAPAGTAPAAPADAPAAAGDASLRSGSSTGALTPPASAPSAESSLRDAPPEAPAVPAPAADPIPEPDYPVDLFALSETAAPELTPQEPAVPAFAADPEPAVAPAPAPEPEIEPEPSWEPEPEPSWEPEVDDIAPSEVPDEAGSQEPQPAAASPVPAVSSGPARVYFAPVRSQGKKSLVERAGTLLWRAGLASAIEEGDLVAVKLHFGETGNTGFVQPIFVREVVARIKEAGGRPFLTDANTLYRGERANAVDHLECAVHNGFSYATVEAPLMIADGLNGRDAVDVPVEGLHFDSVRIGAAAVHADAMVVVSHVKGHEATGFGGALKNVGMGLGCRSAKQRMHADFRPEVTAEKCTACGRCVKWCPVGAIAMGPDRVATIDYEVCYGCGECVAACAFGAIATQWKTEPEAIQEKIVEHVAGALAGKEGKVVYLSFLTNISPDCDCWNFSDAGVVADIGVLASTDIVAIEQAAYDMVTAAAGLPGTRGEGLVAGADKFAAITGIDGTRAIEYAEEMGLGTRAYDLVEVG